MDVDLIFKIAGIGIIVAVLNLVLKRAEREEQAMMTTLAGLIVVLMMIISSISDLFDTVKSMFLGMTAGVVSVCGLCICASLICKITEKYSKEQAMLLVLGVCIFVFFDI